LARLLNDRWAGPTGRAEEEAMKLTPTTGALFAAVSLLAMPACSAHHPGTYHDPGYHYDDYRRGRERAYERGYRDGLKAGAKDWERHRRFDPWRHGRYRDGDSGYRSRYGPRGHYRRAYRTGFRTGYELGYTSPRGWRHTRRARPRW
jgi:hypothetical protein